MSFRNVGGTFETARKLVETALTEYLEKIVPQDENYLVPLFEQEIPNGYGMNANGGGNLWPVDFENEPASPALVSARDGQKPWFSARVVDNFSRQIGIGRFGLARSYLMGSVDVYVREGSGTARARLILDELSAWYKNLSSENGGFVDSAGMLQNADHEVNVGLTREEWAAVTIRQPEIKNAPQDTDKWFRLRLIMEIEVDKFYTDERQPAP